MGKKNDKNLKRSQYDDYEEEFNYKRKSKNKKKENDYDFVYDVDVQKQKANNRYLNKKRDKNKYDRDDDWN